MRRNRQRGIKPDTCQTKDFESELVITLFGVGYSLMALYFEQAVEIHVLLTGFFWHSLVVFFLLIFMPLLIILVYVYYSHKGIIRPVSHEVSRFRSFAAIFTLKIVAIAGTPYAFFYQTMLFLEKSIAPGTVVVIRYTSELVTNVYPLFWLMLSFLYAGWQCQNSQVKRTQ